ncbi:cytidylate kinase [Anaerosolibacter carboniphilus]|uniref:Cytidylate kinase n=1 Tax=Anaerosolibacter carboniphilus TaxID=1417629 RepID=A0A841KTE5_9FIRM|nr:(d)CMP kinase [Anaerosolibacter carboniphilus]MBB6216681.1 cytidylate kinase [Anaerosolibacter carboniphilus]
MSLNKISIAIDGPAGAGKSTIAKLIARTMNLTYIDTGAMYRAITFKILRDRIDLSNEIKLLDFLNQTKIDIVNGEILLDDLLITEKLRTPEINHYVSNIAQIPIVRKKMVELQRRIAANHNVIMDGRDIGTTVLPNATHKFFITASIEERAQRRYNELCIKGFHQDLQEVQAEIEQRDKIDTERTISPLKKHENAILIDTTGMTIEEVTDKILSYIK